MFGVFCRAVIVAGKTRRFLDLLPSGDLAMAGVVN